MKKQAKKLSKNKLRIQIINRVLEYVDTHPEFFVLSVGNNVINLLKCIKLPDMSSTEHEGGMIFEPILDPNHQLYKEKTYFIYFLVSINVDNKRNNEESRLTNRICGLPILSISDPDHVPYLLQGL